MLNARAAGNEAEGLARDRPANAGLAWRNAVAYWHLHNPMTECGCDDDTAATDYCEDSVAWATTYIGAGTLSRI